MPKASKATASDSMQVEGYEGHYENFDGGYTVAFETYTQDADPAEMFKGLPDDRCQCPHWGYVIKGKVTFKTAAGEETFEAGDAYYVGPGPGGDGTLLRVTETGFAQLPVATRREVYDSTTTAGHERSPNWWNTSMAPDIEAVAEQVFVA